MHSLVCFNGQIAESSEVRVRAVSSAALYGKGVFTTMRVVKGAPLWLDKHLARLRLHASRIDFPDEYFPNEKRLNDSVKNLIERNQCVEGKLRLTIFDENSSGLWQIQDSPKIKSHSWLITTSPLEKISETFRVCLAEFPIHSRALLSGVKSCNYTANLQQLRQAQNKGFDECLILNEKGNVVSAATANIFAETDGKIFTPPLSEGCLDGITRAFVIETCRQNAVPIYEKEFSVNDLEESSLFLTSSGIGIKQVTQVEEQKLEKHKSTFFSILNRFYSKRIGF